ncbi:hypothetical protein F1880_007902 [Penicillium rolfsii]|nr:hypothetical protein F1880_007902 [Penicillium rolfsii]
MKILKPLAGAAMLCPLTAVDWQFKSRPDLALPRLNITIPATTEGQDVLFSFEGDYNPAYGHGHGHATLLNQHYETVRELRAGHHTLTEKHEFHVIDEQAALIQVYQPVPIDLSRCGGSSEQQWIWDIATGNCYLRGPAVSMLVQMAGAGYNSSDAWDYFHINSVEKDPEGNYLISARDTCAVHKTNGTTGEIIWRLGGLRSDFDFGPNIQFCFQHHALFLSHNGCEEIITLFDNSAHGTENHRGHEVHTHPFSQGKIISVTTATWTARIVQAFQPPDDLLAKSQGSEGAKIKFRPDGMPIFHAYLDSGLLSEGVQNYRAFRYNWTGLPAEEPAIVAEKTASGTAMYVSWNGDSETALWRFYAVTDQCESRLYLGDLSRRRFETKFVLLGHDGRILRTTQVVFLHEEILAPIGRREFGACLAVWGQTVLHW